MVGADGPLSFGGRPYVHVQFESAYSVTRSGDLLDFGQLFKAFGNNQFAQISHILRQFL